ncbi:hypothetical protein E4U13_008171, partial [Claviceps humidiphila]
MALVLNQQDERIFLYQRIQDLERQIEERDKELRQERERALQKGRITTLQLANKGDGILQQFQEREREIQEGGRQNQKRKRRDQQKERQVEKKQKMLQQERDNTLEQAQEREAALQQERDRALQQVQDRERQVQDIAKALQQAYERERQAEEIAKALKDVRERKQQVQEERRQFHEMATAWRQDQAIARALQEAKETERQAEKRETALQQERDKALQRAQNGERQALERARALNEERGRALRLERERDWALKLVQEKDLALQASTLDEYVKECHGSLFSKLTIHPEAQHGRDATTADVGGKWQPRKVMEWTGFLREQRLIFNHVCDVFTPAVRPFPRLITVKENGNKIAPITDEASMARFISDSIVEPVKNIMRELQSVDKLSRI